MKELNFAKRRNTWKVTIPYSGAENGIQELHIKSPSKNVLTEMLDMEKNIDGQKIDAKAIGAMWEFAAVAMSCNLEKVEIDPDELAEDLSVDDLLEFYTAYKDFVYEQREGKN